MGLAAANRELGHGARRKLRTRRRLADILIADFDALVMRLAFLCIFARLAWILFGRFVGRRRFASQVCGRSRGLTFRVRRFGGRHRAKTDTDKQSSEKQRGSRHRTRHWELLLGTEQKLGMWDSLRADMQTDRSSISDGQPLAPVNRTQTSYRTVRLLWHSGNQGWEARCLPENDSVPRCDNHPTID